MPQPLLRLACPGDAHEIAVLSRCLIEIGLRGWTWHPKRVARALRARDTAVIAAETRGHLAGFAIMAFGDTAAHLSLIAVKPAYQGRGIGRAMMDWLTQSALTAGITRIGLELRASNSGARGFYRLLGYREIGFVPGYYGGIEAAVRMARDIRVHVPLPRNNPASAA
jgi:ribosomal-protein-alanine N-acetyltransferase